MTTKTSAVAGAATGQKIAHTVGMETKRPRSGSDRRATRQGGRRASDGVQPGTRMEVGLGATVLWSGADGTRCWIAHESGRVVVAVSRETRDIRVELCESDKQASDWAAAWRREYDSGNDLTGGSSGTF
jgi:CubicO group peptidase (beta-lactamase class C family)